MIHNSHGNSQSDEPVLVPMDDYHAGMAFRVVGRLPASITIELLRLPNRETVPVLERPDEYTGYVVRSRFREDQVGSSTFVFTPRALDLGARYRFLADVQVFSERLRLLRSAVRKADDGNRPEGG